MWLLKVFPSVFGGARLRKYYYSKFWGHSDFVIPNDVTINDIKSIKVGHFFRVCPDVKIFTENEASIIIGDNFFANYNCFFSANKENIIIGNDCLLGPDVLIINSNHSTKANALTREQANVAKEIIIGNNVWIGAKSIILPGVIIGDTGEFFAGTELYCQKGY